MHEPDCASLNGKPCDCYNNYEWSDEYQRTVMPTVGMGATYTIGSDSYPMTVVAVERNGTRLLLGHDDEKSPTLFVPASLETRRPDQLMVVTRRRDGCYRPRDRCGHVALGVRRLHLCREF